MATQLTEVHHKSIWIQYINQGDRDNLQINVSDFYWTFVKDHTVRGRDQLLNCLNLGTSCLGLSHNYHYNFVSLVNNSNSVIPRHGTFSRAYCYGLS